MLRLAGLRGWTFICGLFLGMLIAIALLIPIDGNASGPGTSVIEPHNLLRQLRNQGLRLYYMEDWTGTIVYLTEEPRPIEELMCLTIFPSSADRWKATVRLWKRLPDMSTDTSDWNDCGFQVGDCLIFGDPVLVKRIREMLNENRRVPRLTW